MSKWAISGLGFISQRHIDAIKDIGDELVVACDIDVEKREKLPKEVKFFDSFDRMFSSKEFESVDWVAICTPNDLHFEQASKCLNFGKKVICEKPLVIKPSSMDILKDLGKDNLFPILQLRYNPELIEFKEWLDKEKRVLDGELRIKLNRGDFYWKGWKVDENRSGGLLYNIGIHYFDLLFWFFGSPVDFKVNYLENKKAAGLFQFLNVNIKWELSLEAPMDNQIRKLTVGDKELDLTRNFEGLHTKVYEYAKQGIGVPLSEVGRTIEIIDKMKKL